MQTERSPHADELGYPPHGTNDSVWRRPDERRELAEIETHHPDCIRDPFSPNDVRSHLAWGLRKRRRVRHRTQADAYLGQRVGDGRTGIQASSG